jgi:serine/threonine protein kinase
MNNLEINNLEYKIIEEKKTYKTKTFKLEKDGKYFFAKMPTDEKYSKYFINENNILNKLKDKCKNIIETYAFDRHKNIILFPYIEHKDLLDFISEKRNKLSFNTILNIFKQICEIIKCCHENNIYHRDIKPENILYDVSKNKIILIDFDLSKESNDNKCKGLAGTLEYSS